MKLKGTSINKLNALVFVCALLSALVPRYISTFKIHLGINISLYTIAVVLVYVLFSHRIVLYRKIESYFIVIWFLFVLSGMWRAEQIGIWGYYVDWTLTAILFAQVLYTSDRSRVFDSIIKGLLLGMLIHLFIGFIEINVLHNYFFSVSITRRIYYGRVPVSIFHNPNDYVTFLITIFPFLIYRMMQQKTYIRRGIFLFFICFALYMIVRSESRSAFFAMVLLGMAILWLAFRKSNLSKLLIISGIIAGAAVALGIPRIRTRIFSVFYTNRVDIEVADRARMNLIRNGFYFLRKTYGAGVGAGNLYKWLEERSIYPIGQLRFMHNWYIELLVTFGVVFFVLYMVFHIKIIVRLARGFNPKDRFWNLNNSILISFICFSIVSIASSSNIYSEWIWMYLIFVATYAMFKKDKDGMKAGQRRLTDSQSGPDTYAGVGHQG